MATNFFSKSGRKLANARRLKGYKLKKISEELDIPLSTWSGYERGVSQVPPELREIVKKKLGVSDADFLPDEVDTSDGKMKITHVSPGKRRVPVVSWAMSGSITGRGHFEDLANQIDETVDTDSRDPNAFAIEISGDSMEPTVAPGGVVVLEPNMEAPIGWPVLVKLIDGRVFFKRLYRIPGKIVLESDNEHYDDLEFDQSEIAFIYPAREIMNRAKPRSKRK